MGFAPGARERIARAVHTDHCVCAGDIDSCPAYLGAVAEADARETARANDAEHANAGVAAPAMQTR